MGHDSAFYNIWEKTLAEKTSNGDVDYTLYPVLYIPSPIRRKVTKRVEIDCAFTGELAMEQLRQRDAKKRKTKVHYSSDSSTVSPKSK